MAESERKSSTHGDATKMSDDELAQIWRWLHGPEQRAAVGRPVKTVKPDRKYL